MRPTGMCRGWDATARSGALPGEGGLVRKERDRRCTRWAGRRVVGAGGLMRLRRSSVCVSWPRRKGGG